MSDSESPVDYIHVNCPGCQKLFMVRTGNLIDGLLRFQCSSCSSLFEFSWPQPPGTLQVNAAFVSPPSSDPPLNAAQSKVEEKNAGTVAGTAHKECPHCHSKCAADARECPHCGVIFGKIAKLKTDAPNAINTDLATAWERVIANYTDEKFHEEFIKTCFDKNRMTVASQHYRAILNVNPHEEIAQKMQSRILGLVTSTLQVPEKDVGWRPSKAMNWFISLIVLLMVVAGTISSAGRSLIFIGIFVLVAYGYVIYFINQKE